jgi:hypothetical protein
MNFKAGDYLFFGHYEAAPCEHVIVRDKIVLIEGDGRVMLASGNRIHLFKYLDYSLDGAIANAIADADCYFGDKPKPQIHYYRLVVLGDK